MHALGTGEAHHDTGARRLSPICTGDMTFEGRVVVVGLRGEIDLGAEAALRVLLEEAGLAAGPQGELIVDLSGATFCDVRGFKALLEASRRTRAEGSRFMLRQPSRLVRSMIELTGSGQQISVEGAPRLTIVRERAGGTDG